MRLGDFGTSTPAAPTIGTYGKLDNVRGSFDLVRARQARSTPAGATW